MASVFELVASLTLDTSGYKDQLKQASGETERTAGALNAKSVAIGNVIADLAKKGGEFFVDMAKTGIQYNAQIETYTTALTTALGDEASAAAAIEKIKQDAARTPYSVDGLVKANSYLIMAGESAGEARDTILALGDAVSATGGGNTELERMAQNLQQVKNVGKATSMDIRQFAMAGIDVYGILADYTGKTTAEVQKMTITYDMLSGALQAAAQEGGRYYDAMGRQSETLNGQISTLKDNIQSKLGDAFKGVADLLSGTVLPAANRFVESINFSGPEKDLSNLGKAVATFGAALAAAGVAGFAVEVSTIGISAQATAGYIVIAEKAQLAWNAAMAAAPYVVLAAGIAAIIASCIDYSASIDAAVESSRNYGETSDEVAAKLAEVRAEYNSWKEAADNGATEYNIYETMTLLEQEITALEARYAELSAAEEAASQSGGSYRSTLSDGLIPTTEEAQEATQRFKDDIGILAQQYVATYESIGKSVKKWFGTFEEAKVSVKTNVTDMIKAMQSQIDFNNSYAQNLDYLAQNGLGKLGESFQNMGKDGAAYAQALVSAIEEAGGATSEGGQKIINEFMAMSEGVQSSQESLTQSLTNVTGEFDAAFAQMLSSEEAAVAAMNMAPAAGASGAATVAAYVQAIAGGSAAANAAAASVARSAAAGFGGGNFGRSTGGGGIGRSSVASFAVGADYIPYDDFPAYLHKGEMVIPSKISEELRDFLNSGGRQIEQQPTASGNGEVIGLLRELIAATKRPVVLDSGALIGGIGYGMNEELGDMDSLGRRGVSFA